MTRDEALKKMQAVKSYMTSGNPIWSVTEIGEAFDMAIEALEQPERKTGEWIEIPDGIFASTYKCSKCGASPVLDEYDWAFSHYCPNCGARMVQKGEDNG